jgi:hypothetical protein
MSSHRITVLARRAAIGATAGLALAAVGCSPGGGTNPFVAQVQVPGSYTIPLEAGGDEVDYRYRTARACFGHDMALDVTYSTQTTGDPVQGQLAVAMADGTTLVYPGSDPSDTDSTFTTEVLDAGCVTVTYAPPFNGASWVEGPILVTIDEHPVG